MMIWAPTTVILGCSDRGAMAISFYDGIMVFTLTIALHFLSLYSKYGVSEHPLAEFLGVFEN